jgi:hypothetical protein
MHHVFPIPFPAKYFSVDSIDGKNTVHLNKRPKEEDMVKLVLALGFWAMPLFALNNGYDPNFVGTGNGCIAGENCYYIDYENGSDNNDGLAKTVASGHGPWKNAPGMASATGQAAAHALSQKDEFILKGGVTWPRACFPWVLSGGNMGTPNSYAYPGMYVGYDPAWNKGTVNSVRVIDPGAGCTNVQVVVTNAAGDQTGAGATGIAMYDTNVGISGEDMVSFVQMTNLGNNYTKNPIVNFIGTAKQLPTAVADITSPILDGSAGVFGTATTMYSMIQLNTTGITFDHFEIAHDHFYSGSDYSCSVGAPVMISASNDQEVLQNLYVHDFVMDGPVTAQLTDCRNMAGTAALMRADHGNNNQQTINNSIFNNYESQAHGCYGHSGPCVQCTAVNNIKTNTNNVYSDWRGGLYTGWQTGNLVAGNIMWASLRDANQQHGDTYYLMGGGITYNNIVRDIFPGTAAYYVENGDGATPVQVGFTNWLFNNLAWNIGTSTPPIGWTSEFTSSSATSESPLTTMKAYNNTFYAYMGNTSTINSGQWFGASPTLSSGYTFDLKNNFSISDQTSGHWFGSNGSPASCPNGCGVWNGLTAPNSAATQNAIDAVNVIVTPAAATSQGYVPANDFAPTAAGNSSVTFANGGHSTNFTSLCGQTVHNLSLAALCQDILGNPRPATGGWEAGAYQYTPIEIRRMKDEGRNNNQAAWIMLPNPVKAALLKQFLARNADLKAYDLAGNVVGGKFVAEGIYFLRPGNNPSMLKVAVIK